MHFLGVQSSIRTFFRPDISAERRSTRTLTAAGTIKKIVDFNLADIGEGITECEVVQWFVKEGDYIKEFDKVGTLGGIYIQLEFYRGADLGSDER